MTCGSVAPTLLLNGAFFISRGFQYGRMDCFMHNFRLRIYLVLGLIFSVPVQAQTTVTPVGVNSASINSSGQVVSMQTFRATYAGQPDSYYSRAVAYNKATTGKLGRARAFVKGNALNLGIVAGTLALGYVLDEITKDIYPNGQQGTPSITCNPRFMASSNLGGVAYGCTVSAAYSKLLQQCNSTMSTSSFAPGYCVFPAMTSVGTTNTAYYFSQRFNSQVNTNTSITIAQQAQSYTQPAVAGTPATDAQMHDAMFPQPMWEKNGYLGDNLPELLRDPATGAVELTQEVQDVATQIQNQHNLQYNPASTPVTSPTVDPNYTSTTNNPAPTSQPAFCGWASAVCDFINWFKNDTTTEPTTVALPQQTLTYTAPEWSSGLGSGSCPSPNTISVLGGSFEISYQPFCTLAEMIKYLVLALAYITSAMIISGVRK